MKANYKLMGVILCGTMLLAAGCGAKTESVSSVAVSEEPASSAASEAASSEAASESVAESAAASEEAASSGSGASSEAPAASKEEPRAESKAESKAEVKAESKAQPAASSKETKTEAPAKSESKPAAETAPAAPTETASLETALKYVGKDVSKLYAAIGKPGSSEYASSCIGDGEDGLLYYDGFTVTTYREGGKETVQDAY